MERELLKPVPTVGPGGALEFLLVANDYDVLKPIASVAKQLEGHLNCAITVIAADQYVRRRKLDGVIVDLGVSGALDFIASIRSGSSNRLAVIFACAATLLERNDALHAGATFVLQKPLTIEGVHAMVQATQPMMLRERRRYFRQAISVPVFVGINAHEERLLSINVSEGGMAVRGPKPLVRGTLVNFRFGLSLGPEIQGKGEIAWANEEGVMGIRFHHIKEEGQQHLTSWLEQRERVGSA